MAQLPVLKPSTVHLFKAACLILLAFLLSPHLSLAQDITLIRDINAIPDEQIAVLEAEGENLFQRCYPNKYFQRPGWI